MREFRSPNPLIDVRRPQNGAVADLNPPGFLWHPVESATSYEVLIGPNPDLPTAGTRSCTVVGRRSGSHPTRYRRFDYGVTGTVAAVIEDENGAPARCLLVGGSGLSVDGREVGGEALTRLEKLPETPPRPPSA